MHGGGNAITLGSPSGAGANLACSERVHLLVSLRVGALVRVLHAVGVAPAGLVAYHIA